MTHLTIMRGYPASGKTTLARRWMALKGDRPRARSNRDDLRLSQFGVEGVMPYAQEQHLSDIQQDAVRKLLKRGYDVIVDDTNLKLKYARAWADLAREQGAQFHVFDVPTPVDDCVLNDYSRGVSGGRTVGEDVIRELGKRFPLGRWPEVKPSETTVAGSWEVYTPPKQVGPNPPVSAYIVDIDGTVAKKRMGEGSRGWHEYDRVGEDVPNPRVIELVRTLAERHRIIFLSGRKDSCREQTRLWLEEHIGGWAGHAELYMRDTPDNRSDDIVKYELFNEHIRDEAYQVVGVLDDRDRVVAMWRALGLTVYQVDYGNF